jgi:hypothetical protein
LPAATKNVGKPIGLNKLACEWMKAKRKIKKKKRAQQATESNCQNELEDSIRCLQQRRIANGTCALIEDRSTAFRG